MDTNVILCKWKKTIAGWRLWVKGRPDVFGQAEHFDDAQEALTDAIWKAAEDLDAVIPTVPVYDPPLPPDKDLDRYCQPELYLVSGDEVFEFGDETTRARDTDVITRDCKREIDGRRYKPESNENVTWPQVCSTTAFVRHVCTV